MDKVFVQKAMKFWTEHYGKKMSEEKIRQIVENLTGYFDTLTEWHKPVKNKKNIDNSSE